MSDNCPFCGAGKVREGINPKWSCMTFHNPGVDIRQSHKCMLRKAKAEGYAAGLRDAARAVCKWCEVKPYIGTAKRRKRSGIWMHGAAYCDANNIRRLAEAEGISIEDW